MGCEATQIAKLLKSMMSCENWLTTTWLLTQKFAAQGNGEHHHKRQPENGARCPNGVIEMAGSSQYKKKYIYTENLSNMIDI